jgi:diguanylate cyclase (GGDEF)-like protein
VQASAVARPVSYVLQLGLVAGAYFVAARLSLALAIPPGYATAVWPPSGIALAAALLLGARVLPGIWIGAALANVLVESSVVSAAIIATGNTLEALAAMALIQRHAGNPGRFERTEDVVKFIALCAASAAVAASIAGLAMAWGHSLPDNEGLRGWWTWWQGDATGMIIVAPLILSWSEAAPAWTALKKIEAAAFALVLVAAVVAISSSDASAYAPFSLTFITLPFILWAALRFGQREVTTAIAAGCAVAVWYVLERRELFAAVSLNELLLMLLGFISMVVSTGLVLTAALSERSRDVVQHDPLTGLGNRMLFRERLKRLLAEAAGRSATAFVAILDIDRFKTINDALGREVGDEVLRQIAARLAAEWPDSTVARIDGVHFAIAGFGAERVAAQAAEAALGRCFATAYRVGGDELRVSATMGVALYPGDARQAEVLFTRAESALKKAKATGERYLRYAPAMSERVGEKLALENKLSQALEREEFVLHYQPKVDLDTREIVGVEALIRWQSPERGLVPPVQFIPLLEETGLILEVGAWALRRAVLDQQSWLARGVQVPRVAVNVSSIQLRQRNFVERVQAAIGSGPARIDLEITESRIMEDIEANIGKLRRLRGLGIGIAIDDFGTGYSSLAYLAKLPAQALKIDRTFVTRMLDDEDAMALVQTIISLARTLNLTVVAEGVETEEQADVLATLRCDQMQGYFFSAPRPRDEITPLLRKI